MTDGPVSGSFRDPSGHLFFRNGVLYRQVNRVYQANYDQLIQSGLYDRLVGKKLLVPHREVGQDAAPPSAYKLLQPEFIPFISYPYEWCFGQLKDAALLTLQIQEVALDCGMSLKDASAYNVQFFQGRPVFIDTLSFETYKEGLPWIGYRQFCQHFLAPLALMALTDIRLASLSRDYIDGVPLDLASRLLPGRSRLRLGLLTHVHLHAGTQRRYQGKQSPVGSRRGVSKNALRGILSNLRGSVEKLHWKPGGTTWGDYYSATNYTETAFEQKKALVRRLIEKIAPSMVWDLGSNTGVFSRLASESGIPTVAFDIDPSAVEQNYQRSRRESETLLLPLLMDFTNPSPAIGWLNRERDSLFQRGPVDLALALALVHHLAIGNNVPLRGIVSFFHSVCRSLVIEFVPKEDSQVRRMLTVREDVFEDYNQENFEREFSESYRIRESVPVPESCRMLYWMDRIG